MALNKDDFAKAMIDAVKSEPDGGAKCMKKLGEAIESYLADNTDAQYAWVGVNTVQPFNPDTTTSFKAKIQKSGVPFSCSPSAFSDFILALSNWLK